MQLLDGWRKLVSCAGVRQSRVRRYHEWRLLLTAPLHGRRVGHDSTVCDARGRDGHFSAQMMALARAAKGVAYPAGAYGAYLGVMLEFPGAAVPPCATVEFSRQGSTGRAAWCCLECRSHVSNCKRTPDLIGVICARTGLSQWDRVLWVRESSTLPPGRTPSWASEPSSHAERARGSPESP